MNYDMDNLLDMVDGWKHELSSQLEKLTPTQRAKYWKAAHARSIARGLRVADVPLPQPPKRKSRRKATG